MKRIAFIVVWYAIATWQIFDERLFGYSVRGIENLWVILIYITPLFLMWLITSDIAQWFARIAQERDVKSFLSIIKSMDGREVALVALFANNFRQEFEKETRVDLHDPMLAYDNDPGIVLELSMKARRFQKSGRNPAAASVMVWVHTLRGAADPHLRKYSREVWGELERGFEYVGEASAMLLFEERMMISTDGATDFPIGFTPRPI